MTCSSRSRRRPRTPSARPIFEKIQKMWTDEVPTVPIFQGNLYVFTKKNVTGVKIGPTLIFNYDQLKFTEVRSNGTHARVPAAGPGSSLPSMRHLLSYVLTRLLLAIPMVFIMLTLVFVVLRVMPGRPCERHARRPRARRRSSTRRRQELGLNKPIAGAVRGVPRQARAARPRRFDDLQAEGEPADRRKSCRRPSSSPSSGCW